SHLQPVLQDYSQPVSVTEAEGGQPAPHAADLAIPRRVAEPPLPVDDRQRVRIALDHGEKGAAQIKHGPGLDKYWWRGLRGGCSETVSGRVSATLSVIHLMLEIQEPIFDG